MGRRSVRLSDQDRWVFNRVARDYAARPPYPDALVDLLATLAGGPGGRALDLGAGTGLLTLPLAARRLHVCGVEPATAMLAIARERLATGDPELAPRVRLVHATAEETGLAPGAFDLVFLADAVQWVDPELAGREVARVVRPLGVVAVIEATFAATPFMDALGVLLARANPKARPRPPGRVRQLLAIAAGDRDGAPREERFRQEVLLDGAALEQLLRSLSYMGPALGAGGAAALGAEARTLAGRSGGAPFTRELTVRWAAANAARA